MEPGTAIAISVESLKVLLKLSLPILSVALGVGLVISLFQALTQIQEPTISFVPKIIAVFAVLFFLMNYFGEILNVYVEHLSSYMIHLE